MYFFPFNVFCNSFCDIKVLYVIIFLYIDLWQMYPNRVVVSIMHWFTSLPVITHCKCTFYVTLLKISCYIMLLIFRICWVILKLMWVKNWIEFLVSRLNYIWSKSFRLKINLRKQLCTIIILEMIVQFKMDKLQSRF